MMFLHCSTATATEYPMLALRQDAVFVMIAGHEERHSDFHFISFHIFKDESVPFTLENYFLLAR